MQPMRFGETRSHLRIRDATRLQQLVRPKRPHARNRLRIRNVTRLQQLTRLQHYAFAAALELAAAGAASFFSAVRARMFA